MRLKELVRELADFILHTEQQTHRSTEDAVLTYIHDAVATEVEYRRRMEELDRRLAELERMPEAITTG